MTIERAPRPDANFLLLHNDVARETRLSYRASGILTDILSRPDNWTTSAEKIAAARPDKEGVQAVRTALRELEKVGYLRRRKYRAEHGQFRWRHTIYDVPVPPDPQDISAGQSTSRFPSDGNHPTETAPLKNNREEDLEEDVPVLLCTDSDRFAHSVGGTQDDQEASSNKPSREPASWREQDREAFRAIVGNRLTTESPPWAKASTYSADAIYAAIRKARNMRGKPARWPGRLLEGIYATGGEAGIDDWLIDQGLERADPQQAAA